MDLFESRVSETILILRNGLHGQAKRFLKVAPGKTLQPVWRDAKWGTHMKAARARTY